MKVRNGFVSNSSTSSFLIYGTEVSYEQAEAVEDYLNDHKDVRLSLEYGEDNRYVGYSPCSIKDEETGKQFKTSIEEAIKKMFEDLKFNEGKEVTLKFRYISEAWNDN